MLLLVTGVVKLLKKFGPLKINRLMNSNLFTLFNRRILTVLCSQISNKSILQVLSDPVVKFIFTFLLDDNLLYDAL